MGVFIIVKSIKNVFIHVRSSLKFIFLIIIASVLIIGMVSLFFRVTYSVTLDGEHIGYTNNKVDLQKKINEYMEASEESNTAFIEIVKLPEYSLCLVKKDTVNNDEEILNKVKLLGTTYYDYYAILEGNNEKYYVATKEQAEEVISKLKEKKSSNISKISFNQVFGTEMNEFSEVDSIVTALYVKPTPVKVSTGSYTIASSSTKLNLGISLTKPVSSGYTITSRFGARGSGTHTGLDIAAPTGTPISAAAGGTVTSVKLLTTSYGKHLIIDHGNGVQTLYAHCNSINVSVGDVVAQGQIIGTVGSTGNSSGPHLHLEIIVNGTKLNPQNYLY